MGVTIVEKPVYKAGKLKQIDVYLDYSFQGQARVRVKTPYSLRAGNSKSAQSFNKVYRGKAEELKLKRQKVLMKKGSVSIASRKKVPSTVLTFIKEIRKSLNKPSLYDNLLTSLSGFIEYSKKKDVTFNDIDFDFIERYKAYMINDCGLTQNSARAYMRKLSTAINKARIAGKAKQNKITGLIRHLGFTNDRKLPDYLTSSEIDMIRNYPCNTDLRLTIKQSFLFALNTGLRCEDLASLKWSEIQDGQLHRLDSKTKKPNNLTLSNEALSILQERSNGVQDINGYVFKGLNAKRMTGNLKKWLKPLKLNKNITYHSARRVFSRALLDRGFPIEEIKNLLNHSDIKTTLLYTGDIPQHNNDALKEFAI